MPDPLLAQTADYERITRQVRFVILMALLVTTPVGQLQSAAMVLLVWVGLLYNLLRYNRWLMRQRWFASRITMIVVDTVFVAVLLMVVGRTDMAYTWIFGLIIITATYWYGLRGTFAVLAGQVAMLGLVSAVQPYPPLPFDPIRAPLLTCMMLFTFGLLLERLTRVERTGRTAIMRLDRERQAERERLMALLNSLNDAAAVVDDKGRIAVANSALDELAGRDTEVKGQGIGEVLPLRHRVKGAAKWPEILGNDPQRHRDYVLVDADGAEIDLDISIVPVRFGGLKINNYIILCRDITKEKSLDEQRSEFIAVASHELRTPISIIEASLEMALLPENKLPEAARALVRQAHQNTAFLAGLVQDLTTLSQAQNDAIAIQLQPVDPRALLDRLVANYRPEAEGKKLTLTAEAQPGTPSVLTTERHVQEVLRNFISNAIKYTEKGGIVLGAEPVAGGGMLLSVKDTGIGISKSDQRKLFTKFFRAENFQTRQTGGTGLGLYLCLELAERINGKVWCESKVGHGSTFYLEVPPFSKLGRDHGKVVAAGVSNLVDQI